MKAKFTLFLGILLSLTAVSEAGFYARAGLLYHTSDDLEISGVQDYKAAIDSAAGVTAAVGYKFSVLRLEAEANYVDSDISNTSLADVITSGKYERASFFANVIIEIPFTPLIEPYIGAGVGITRVDIDFSNLASTGSLETSFSSSGDDDLFSYQLLAGIRLSFWDTVSIYGGYRYLNTDALGVREGTYELRAKGGNHLFELGVGLGF